MARSVLAVLTAMVFVSQAQAAAPVFANAQEEANYLTIDAVEAKEIASTAQIVAMSERTLKKNELSISATDIIGVFTDPSSVQAWVTLGMKAWEVVLNNQPVANVSTQRVSVLPQAQTEWAQMSNWQGPVAKTYALTFKNVYGMEVIKHTYTIAYNYGGQFEGKGQYLANATVIPTEVSVLWGFNLNSKVEVAQTLNMGALDNPTPGVELQLQWNSKTVLKHIEGVNSFFIKGNGETVLVNAAN